MTDAHTDHNNKTDSINKQFFINVTCNEMTAKSHLLNTFDFEVIDSMYKSHDDNEHPLVYNFLYKYILTLPKTKTIVTFSPDPAISGSTIAGMAEKYMYSQEINGRVKFMSRLKIIYITSSPHLLKNYKDVTIENLRNSITTHLLGLRNHSYVGNKLVLSADQFTFVGINENLLEENQREDLNNLDFSYFTLKQLRKKGIKNVMRSINDKNADSPVMIIYDMSVTSYEASPCVSRFLKEGIRTSPKFLNGLDISELRELFLEINKTNLVGMDITGFDFRIDNKERAYRITCETAKIPLYVLFGMKEKKINIFNENSKFLIFRPIEQTSLTDLGWFILRGISLETRESIIKCIDDDVIKSITIDLDGVEETVMVTTTTIADQEQKSFYDPNLKLSDCVLFPAQKLYMAFELLNTPENALLT